MKQWFRKIFLHFLLIIFKIGAFFHSKYAINAAEDITMALDDNFINPLRKLIAYMDAHPERIKEMMSNIREVEIKELLHDKTEIL